MRDKLIPPLCASLLMLLAVFLGYHMGQGTTSTPSEVEAPAPLAETATAQAPEGSITIPGFDKLQLSAGQQAAPFYNPEGNACYFVISLFLPSGEEIFRSGLIPPGDTMPTMALATQPPAGVYENSILRYSCYSLEGMQPMNGADVTLTIEII